MWVGSWEVIITGIAFAAGLGYGFYTLYKNNQIERKDVKSDDNASTSKENNQDNLIEEESKSKVEKTKKLIQVDEEIKRENPIEPKIIENQEPTVESKEELNEKVEKVEEIKPKVIENVDMKKVDVEEVEFQEGPSMPKFDTITTDAYIFIIDFGTTKVSAGFPGDEEPSYYEPNVIGYSKNIS